MTTTVVCGGSRGEGTTFHAAQDSFELAVREPSPDPAIFTPQMLGSQPCAIMPGM